MEGDLVRVKRSALCCLSGAKMTLHKTGAINHMSKYLRLSHKAVLHVVVRLFDDTQVEWSFIMKACKVIATEDIPGFYEHFQEYVQFHADCSAAPALRFDHSQTLSKRRKTIDEEVVSNPVLIINKKFPGKELAFPACKR